MKNGKRYAESVKAYDRSKVYDADEAMGIVIDTARAKFDETIELHVRLGVDPRQADQQVRGVLVLPNGTGKSKKSARHRQGRTRRRGRCRRRGLCRRGRDGAEDPVRKLVRL